MPAWCPSRARQATGIQHHNTVCPGTRDGHRETETERERERDDERKEGERKGEMNRSFLKTERAGGEVDKETESLI